MLGIHVLKNHEKEMKISARSNTFRFSAEYESDHVLSSQQSESICYAAFIYTPNKERIGLILLFEFRKGKERQAQQQKRSKTLMQMML
ncbi:hypothetical protein ACTXT7_007736 [Hymenolepis weldensis]